MVQMPLRAGLGFEAARTSVRQSVRNASYPHWAVVQTSCVMTGTRFASGATACSACAVPLSIATIAAKRTRLPITPSPLFWSLKPPHVVSASRRSQTEQIEARKPAPSRAPLLAVLERYAEQLEPVADEAKAELPRHALLQPLDLLV